MCMQNISKYRVSVWLEKSDFLKERIKYIGHDVTEDRKFPAQ